MREERRYQFAVQGAELREGASEVSFRFTLREVDEWLSWGRTLVAVGEKGSPYRAGEWLFPEDR